MKRYLIINHHAPLDGLHTEETLELILSIASLENKVSVLFLQNAGLILLLKKNYQNPERIMLQKTIEAFSLFELENIYVEKYMLQKLINWNLELNNYKNLKAFTWNNLNNLYRSHDIILSF